ncbi:MAG: hypothetical protein Q7S48_01205 [bacterium]|nr:hypothetical protein [bacterium]
MLQQIKVYLLWKRYTLGCLNYRLKQKISPIWQNFKGKVGVQVIKIYPLLKFYLEVKVGWMREHGWIVIKVIALVVSFVALAWFFYRPVEIESGEAPGSSIPVIIVGILGTILLSLAAYKHYRNSMPRSTRPLPTEDATAQTPVVAITARQAPVVGLRGWWLQGVIVVVLLVLVGMQAYKYIPWFDQSVEIRNVSNVNSRLGLNLPAEVALPIIAGCESGGRQFETDGITPLRNRERSGAIGKYQIMAKLHEEKARRLGFDIRTEEGNEAYAKFLYQESGTLHWEADPRSRACWEPKLVALGYSPTSKTFLVVAGREWSENLPVQTGQRVDWMPKSAVTYEIMTADGKTVVFPAKTQAPIEVPSHLSPGIRFRSIDADSVSINVVMSTPR